MKTTLTFLSASVPLVKRFEKQGDTIIKHSYPLVKAFTSSTVEVTTPTELYFALTENALSPNPPCLFKGELIAPLVNESRRAMGRDDAMATYIVLDFDHAPFSSHEEAMRALNIKDTTYVWQYSSSAKLSSEDKTLNGHAFFLLDKPVHPQRIKAWFMYCNLRIDVLKNALTLSRAKHTLHYPLDIVASDNNRLIYIGEPIFVGMQSPIPSKERIQLVKRTSDTLSVDQLPDASLEGMRNEARGIVKQLRAREGLPALKTKTKMVGEWEVQTGVGAATTYQVIDNGGEFIRYNLNGGDSQAYWHPRTNFEYLHSFKGEPSMLMKEILPTRYAELRRMQADGQTTPTEEGDILFAFREKVTGRYYKGTWNPSQYKLDLHTVASRIDLEDFMASHGRTIGDFVPEWHVIYNPREKWVVNYETRQINMFVPPPLMRGRENSSARKTTFPFIQRILDSAVGKGLIQDHFLNWLAVIVQHRRKTGTAWILHGTQGTGKDLLVNRVLRPIFTSSYLQVIRADEVNSQFNSWLERNLLVFINEIDVDLFMNLGAVESRLKQSITDSFMPVRKMRTDAVNPENFVNIILGSNMPQPVRVPLNDRRFNVGVYQPHRFETNTHEVEHVLPTEIEAFAHYLCTREANIDRAASILQTDDRAAIQALGITSVDEFAHSIVTGDLEKLWEYMPDEHLMHEHGLVDANASAYASIMRRCYAEERSKLSRDELLLMFNYAIGDMRQGPNKFTAFLRHHGIILKKIWYNDRPIQGIEIKWTSKPKHIPLPPTATVRHLKTVK